LPGLYRRHRRTASDQAKGCGLSRPGRRLEFTTISQT
jgi:hypothetical protein